MARRTTLLALALLLVAFGAGLGAAVLMRGPSCPVELVEVSNDAGELVAAAELTPEGSVGDERAPVLDAIEGLGGPFGDVVAGRFYPEGSAVPTLVPFGDHVVLARATPTAGDFLAVEVPDGSVRWGKGYDGGAARGGLVGELFVVLVGGASPAVLALDADGGGLDTCVAVPVAGESGELSTLLTDQAGTDVVLAAGPPAAPVTLSRVTPADGEIDWSRELTGSSEAGSVTVVGQSAVVARIGEDPVRLADMAAAGGIGAPMIRAYGLADGEELWSYPGPADFAATAASVVGSEPGSENLLALTARPGRSGSAKATVAELVSLSPAGAERWSVELGAGYWNASLWGDLVVAQGAGRAGGARLRAFSMVDGSAQWTLQSAAFPSRGDQPRTNFGSATAFGDGFVVPAPNGLLLVDPTTGAAQRLDSDVAVEQVLVAGDHLLVRTREALLVLTVGGAP